MIFMTFMTFISMHSVIMCVVLPWRTYQMHPDLSLKSECGMTLNSSQKYFNFKKLLSADTTIMCVVNNTLSISK
jgi:hypothetical protein